MHPPPLLITDYLGPTGAAVLFVLVMSLPYLSFRPVTFAIVLVSVGMSCCRVSR